MARRAVRKDAARKLAIDVARLAHDNNAYDITVLDLRGISPVTDFFVICTGTSDRQMRTVASEMSEHGRRVDQPVWRTAGMDKGDWILLDFVDVVVHIFDQVHRKYYDLELIWGEAPRVRWQRRASPGKRPSPEA